MRTRRERDYEHTPEPKVEGVTVGDTLVVVDWSSGNVVGAGGGSPLMVIAVLAGVVVLVGFGAFRFRRLLQAPGR